MPKLLFQTVAIKALKPVVDCYVFLKKIHANLLLFSKKNLC